MRATTWTRSAELHAAGIEQVHAFAIAFDGKRVRVRLAHTGKQRIGTLGASVRTIRKVKKKNAPARSCRATKKAKR
jgi:hypothetical protein